MPYQRVVTDDEVMWNGSPVRPLLTLADEHGGRAQIVNDDHCHVLLVEQRDEHQEKFYQPSFWWFKEAVVAARDLPLPE